MPRNPRADYRVVTPGHPDSFISVTRAECLLAAGRASKVSGVRAIRLLRPERASGKLDQWKKMPSRDCDLTNHEQYDRVHPRTIPTYYVMQLT